MKKTHVKAPSPGDSVREDTSEERANDACKGEHTSEGSKQERTLFELGDGRQEGQDGDEDS